MKTRKIIIYVLIIILIFVLINLVFKLNDKDKNQIAVISTNYGDIEVLLYDENAPFTVSNFKSYINDDFYDNTVFHRVIEGFMIQGGGFLEDGTKKQTKYPIILESTNKTNLKNDTNTIAMARTIDPNSATSQFFINTVNNDFLNYQSSENPGYAVFGKVIKGMDVVYIIEDIQTKPKGQHQNYPIKEVIIKDVYLK